MDEIKPLKHDIEKLEQLIEILTKEVLEIKKALVGTEYGQQGLVNRIEKAEEEIYHLKDFKKKVLAWATGLGLGSSTLVNAIAELIK